jgi:hypothetical protein
MVLDEGGHNECRGLVEVYDDPQPPTRVEIAAVEALPAGRWIVVAMVWTGDRAENRRPDL